ncbi:MAG: hypothetical protein WDN23_18235 [Edaphobacter sp.]
MALTPGSFFDSDATGNAENVTLKPMAPATTTRVRIASVVYNNVPVKTIDPDRMSFAFSVLNGINLLTVGLVSPSTKAETVQLCQGATQIAVVTVSNTAGASFVFINGT